MAFYKTQRHLYGSVGLGNGENSMGVHIRVTAIGKWASGRPGVQHDYSYELSIGCFPDVSGIVVFLT